MMANFNRENSTLLLVDLQPRMLDGVHDQEDSRSKVSSIVKVTKAATYVGVPVVITTIKEQLNGTLLSVIDDIFEDAVVLERIVPSFNAYEDAAVQEAIDQQDRKNIILVGWWTSVCMTFTALDLIEAGYTVYGLMDGCGDATPLAHKLGMKRMIQAGVIPVTWMPVTSAWMHDWDDDSAKMIGSLFE